MIAEKKLDIAAPNDRDLVFTRAFNASRDLVFDCLSKPELVSRWLLGPPGWTMPVCEIDFRVGGAFRYVWRRDGKDMGLGGVFKEISRPERIVHTEKFDEDWTGGETLVSSLLDEKAGRTTMTMTVRYASKETRDGALNSGMADGMEFGYTRLDDLLDTLR